MCAANDASRGAYRRGSSVPYLVEQDVPIFADMFDLAERGASYCRSSLNCCSFPQHIVSPFLRLSSISKYNGENQQRLEYSASLVPRR